jgi:DNA-binding transcriptional ArsR family regulator
MSVPEDANSKVFASLKHPVRRRILRILSIESKSFSEMQKEFGIESSHLSYHLEDLRNLLHRREDGRYELSNVGKVAFSMMEQVEGTSAVPKSCPIAVKKSQRKHFRIGKYSFRVSPVAVLMMLVICSSVLGYYLYSSFTVPLEIKEPIEILGYPSGWSLYPGETTQFNVSVRNHSPLNYSVVLDFTSDDMAYQSNYITFSDENYTVIPGQQNLGAWLNVSLDAPAANLNVTVTVARGSKGYSKDLLVNGDFETGNLMGWETFGVCTAESQIVHSGSYAAYISDQEYDNFIVQNISLPVDTASSLEAWIYPLRVGPMGPLDEPYSAIHLVYCFKNDRSIDRPAFEILYTWSYNTWSDHPNTLNSTGLLCFRLDFQSLQWNKLSRDVTSEVREYFTGYDLSNIALQYIICRYHYSNGSPGAFYVDDLKMAT